MPQQIFQVDAFTDKLFAGNPAAVCIMDRPAQPEWMQRVAMEMNLSETAFVWPMEDGNLNLRWFTPTTEVDLCGHATLAAAHVLCETGELHEDEVARFQTRSGLLTARRGGEWIEMDFPATPARRMKLKDATPATRIESDVAAGVPPSQPGVAASAPSSQLDAAAPARTIGSDAAALGGKIDDNDAIISHLLKALGCRGEVSKTAFDYLVEVADQSIVRAIQPDLPRLKKIPTRGVIVTARSSDPAFDFISRFFAPQSGIDEDPVTGSAHCALGPYWRDRLHKDSLVAFQASRRGGIVRVKVQGNRVLLAGQAVTVMRGMLTV